MIERRDRSLSLQYHQDTDRALDRLLPGSTDWLSHFYFQFVISSLIQCQIDTRNFILTCKLEHDRNTAVQVHVFH